MIQKFITLVLTSLLAGCAGAVATSPPPDSLASTSWVLESLNGQPIDVAAGISLAFSDGGTLNGSDGCNDYTAGYTVNGTTISILPPVGTTQNACPATVVEQSTAYLAALTEAARYQLEGEKLELLASDGTGLASLQQVSP
jgi:heat shock protein HslJ